MEGSMSKAHFLLVDRWLKLSWNSRHLKRPCVVSYMKYLIWESGWHYRYRVCSLQTTSATVKSPASFCGWCWNTYQGTVNFTWRICCTYGEDHCIGPFQRFPVVVDRLPVEVKNGHRALLCRIAKPPFGEENNSLSPWQFTGSNLRCRPCQIGRIKQWTGIQYFGIWHRWTSFCF